VQQQPRLPTSGFDSTHFIGKHKSPPSHKASEGILLILNSCAIRSFFFEKTKNGARGGNRMLSDAFVSLAENAKSLAFSGRSILIPPLSKYQKATKKSSYEDLFVLQGNPGWSERQM